MNDLQKFAQNIAEALKPLIDIFAQKPPIETPGMCKTVTIEGLTTHGWVDVSSLCTATPDHTVTIAGPVQSDMGALRKSIDPSFRISWHLPDDCDECQAERAYGKNTSGSPGKIYDKDGVWLGDE